MLLAFNANANKKNEAFEAYCNAQANVAKGAMSFRQEGREMSEIFDMVKGKRNQKVIKKTIMSAYEQPRAETKKYQEIMVLEFKNKVHLECLKQDIDETIEYLNKSIN